MFTLVLLFIPQVKAMKNNKFSVDSLLNNESFKIFFYQYHPLKKQFEFTLVKRDS